MIKYSDSWKYQPRSASDSKNAWKEKLLYSKWWCQKSCHVYRQTCGKTLYT